MPIWPWKRGDPAKSLRRLAVMLDETQAALLPAQERHRRERRKPGRKDDRSRPRSAAAMRSREGLVEIDMHRVDAEIAGSRLAHDRVEIRPIAIKIGPGLMHQSGDFDDILLEQPTGVGIGQHDRSDVRPEPLLDGGRIEGAIGARRNRAHLEASARRRGRIGAMRRLRHKNDLAASSLLPWRRSRP